MHVAASAGHEDIVTWLALDLNDVNARNEVRHCHIDAGARGATAQRASCR